ncbi:hypothetical protein HGM15179_003079 [Zosterops borbonicus]|uniref:Uncharacterized protein n=1 Tax=Zosterops borbonicus TaxID=364589 RepID=A0A8K1GSL7_9PASS|nr:hypothetical protein HGM15179_003079 [Zosterops borbonicus]
MHLGQYKNLAEATLKMDDRSHVFTLFYMTPVDYDEEKCESIFNKETCSYKVVEKDDHSKECPVHSWVGVAMPKKYDRVNCVGLFHKKSCSIRVVKKTNPEISCKVYNGYG